MPQNYWPDFKDHTNEQLLEIICASTAPNGEKMGQLLDLMNFRTAVAQIEATIAQKEAAIAATQSAKATRDYTCYTFYILIVTLLSVVANLGFQIYNTRDSNVTKVSIVR